MHEVVSHVYLVGESACMTWTCHVLAEVGIDLLARPKCSWTLHNRTARCITPVPILSVAMAAARGLLGSLPCLVFMFRHASFAWHACACMDLVT